jgi:hypothetical protein
VELLRESVARTQASGTAALRFVSSQSGGSGGLAGALVDGGHSASAMALGAMDRLARQVRSRAGISEIGGRPGVADFQQQRFLYAQGDDDDPNLTLFAPGLEYSSGPDDWELVRRDADVIGQAEPAWLLAAIVGVVEAHREGNEKVRGQAATCYAVTVSFSEAAGRMMRTLERPWTGTADVDLNALPCRVWLDSQGRIVKAVLQRGGAMMLELSDFGAPERVELPNPDSVWSADS